MTKQVWVPDDWCEHCHGTGYRSNLGPMTADEFYEAFDDDEDMIREYTTRGGAYDVPCPVCHGSGRASAERVEEWLEDQADLRTAWMEDGCPEGSFSAAYPSWS